MDDLTSGAAGPVTVDDLSRIVESSLNEVYVFGLSDLRFLYVNRPARENLGYSMAQLQQLTPVDIKPEFDDAAFRAQIAPLVAGEQRKLAFETLHERADGSTYPVEVHLQTGQYSQRPVATAIILDITDRVRDQRARAEIEAQIQQTQKLESLGILAGGIAHDFNNILTGILGFADLALHDIEASHSAHGLVKEVVKGAQRAAELTEQMLAYSGKGKFVVEAVDLRTLIADMGRLLEISVPGTCELRYDFSEDLPAIRADVTQIRQVILNLILNASDAVGGDTPGTITVTTGAMYCDEVYLEALFPSEKLQPGDFVFLEVEDTGIGMDEATRKRIFDPFFTTKESGRGLGLSAILGIVLGHEGSIKVYSEPGEGSTFKLFFPALQTAAQTATAPVAVSGWQGSGRVLIVEDEEIVRNLAAQLFARMGFEVVTAEDGVQGVAAFRDNHEVLSLVFLDMTMPHMGGAEAFERMREIDPDVPTLLCSGHNEQTAVNRLTQPGLARFLRKPYTYNSLVEAVQALVTAR